MDGLAAIASALLEEVGAARPPIMLQPILAYLGLSLVTVDAGIMRRLYGHVAPACPVDGFLLPDSMVVAVNGAHPLSRQRFTVAHEIGEYLHRQPGNSRQAPLLSMRGKQRYSGHERAMNDFAAALLMPESMVLAEWSRWQNTRRDGFVPRFSDLCSTFGVSRQAMSFRMRHITAHAGDAL